MKSRLHLRRPLRLAGTLACLCALVFHAFVTATRAEDTVTPEPKVRPESRAEAPPLTARQIEAIARQYVKPGPVKIGATTYYPFAFEGHVHSLFSRDARHSVQTILTTAQRIGLDAIIMTDHGTTNTQREFARYQGPLVPFPGQEIGGQFGHAVMWNTPNTDVHDPNHTTLTQRCDFAHKQGGLLVFAHPGWWINGNGHDPMEWMTADAMRHGGKAGSIDALEIWNGVYRTPLPKLIDAWVALLEQGVYVPVVGNSDFHQFKFHKLASARSLAFCDKPDVKTCLWQAVREGRLMVTDGPYAVLSVNDKLPGASVDPAGAALTVSVEALAPDGGVLQLYVGKQIVQKLELPAGAVKKATWQIPAPKADTYVRLDILRATKTRGQTPISLLSNPVLVDLAPAHAWR